MTPKAKCLEGKVPVIDKMCENNLIAIESQGICCKSVTLRELPPKTKF